jgi:RNA polymerase sigma-70 factor (ECF subfamily)
MNVVTESLATATAASADEVGRLVTAHYERRGRELWGLARRLGASDEQAADVVQEAHLRLWRELSAGQQIADVDGWLFRVAYRLVMDEHRGLRRIRELAGRLTQPGPAATAPTTDIDDAVSLWPLVDRLPARERATLYLRYRADLSFEQIGEVMGITPASARTYASRGTDRLRQLLPDEGERR